LKDNFSTRSREYSKYRPKYPDGVFKFIKDHLNGCEAAWDCGTGNGQVAIELAKFFSSVEATDISGNQLKNAVKKNNIHYTLQPAEKTNFNSARFDLIISAQAVHWFDFERFFAEVNRCIRPDGIIVLLGYGLFYSNNDTNQIIREFYNDTIGPYWDPERSHLDENYRTIPFPFEETDTPGFEQRYQWSIEHLLGYLRTWSAVKHYENKNNLDPVSIIEQRLREAFGNSNEVVFPIIFRMGKIRKPD